MYPYKLEAESDLTHTEEKAVPPQRQRLECCSHKPVRAGSPQKLKEGRAILSPYSL